MGAQRREASSPKLGRRVPEVGIFSRGGINQRGRERKNISLVENIHVPQPWERAENVYGPAGVFLWL